MTKKGSHEMPQDMVELLGPDPDEAEDEEDRMIANKTRRALFLELF